MLSKNASNKVIEIWNDYIKQNRRVVDTKGNNIPDIDAQRRDAIVDLSKIIKDFLNGSSNVHEFKTQIDSYNKRNNLWGFTATKGQMFFNQLVKNNEKDIDELTEILRFSISEPANINQSLKKIDKLEKFARSRFNKASDKRKVANPGSTGYFLSYFWQISNFKKWPVAYTSLIRAYQELELWKDFDTQVQEYQYFYELNDSIKELISKRIGTEINNWEAEHAFWNFKGNPNSSEVSKSKSTSPKIITHKESLKTNDDIKGEDDEVQITAGFELTDYVIPKVAGLVQLGSDTELSSSSKGSAFENMVNDIFNLLDFEVKNLGQGSGRNPDGIIKYREGNTAFIIDAKAYSKGYKMGLDDRAIKEYINHHSPKLQKDGYMKIGFIIVSNSFASNLDEFVNDITWNTPIKRFILLTSEALLYLLAYKTKDRLYLDQIIESLVQLGNPIEASDIISKFEDI